MLRIKGRPLLHAACGALATVGAVVFTVPVMTIGVLVRTSRLSTSRLRLPSMVSLGEFPLLMSVAMAATLIAVADGPVALRVVFGIPLVVFVPGYAVTSALFPSWRGLGGLERLVLSFGLSFAVMSLLALGVDRTRWGLTVATTSSGLVAISVLASVVAIVRRGALAEEDRFAPRLPRLDIPPPARWDRSTRVAVDVIMLSVLVLAASGITLVASQTRGEDLTQFALYSESGEPRFYPRDLVAGQPATIVLEIDNREGEDVRYSIQITAEGAEVQRIENIVVRAGDTWRERVEFTVDEPGDGIPVTFNLHTGDIQPNQPPYRSLTLFVSVRSTT